MATTATAVVGMTMGQLIDELFQVREKIRKANAKLKEMEAEKRSLEESVLEALDSQGVSKSTGRKATASISENDIASVDDWDEFNKWVRKNNAFYLYQRRVNSAPYRELMVSRRNRKLPGVTTLTQRKLNLRKL